jgi:hypothetical protein
LDRGDGTGEALAGILREGNAASNTAADHLAVLDLTAWRRALARSAAASGPPRRGPQDALHPRRGAPLPGVHHQPARPRPGRPGGAPPSPRPGGGPHPLRQGQRAPEPPLLRLWRQRRLAGPGRGRHHADLLGAGATAGRPPPECRRAQDLAVPAVAYPGRIVGHARRQILRLPRAWPWTTALVAAFRRVRALPAPG